MSTGSGRLRSLLGVGWFPLECAGKIGEWYGNQVCHIFSRSRFSDGMLHMLDSVRLQSPCLLCMCGVLGYWGTLGKLQANLCKTFLPSSSFFCLVGTLWKDFGSKCFGTCDLLWHLWIGGAAKPGLGPQHVAVEVFDVGAWLTHGDLALETEVDYLARLRGRGLASIWAPASQDSSHVGNAGVGVVSMRGAPILCLRLPLLSFGVFLTLVVLLGACFLWVVVGS